jgi:MFS family permease
MPSPDVPPAPDFRADLWARADPLTRDNLALESLFSAFNGVYLALALVAAPVVAVVGVGASPLELTILVSAFPVGAFLGPLWAYLGHRWGMKALVTRMALCANLPLLLLFWVGDPVLFTVLITISQLLNSAMRMGQSSLYGVLYPRPLRGRVLGRLTFWTYLTMVPSLLLTGWLLTKSHEAYRVLYPLAGLCGLVGCWYYRQLLLPRGTVPAGPFAASLRAGERRPAPAVAVGGAGGFGGRVREVERVLAQDRNWVLFQAAFFLSGSAFFMSTHVVLVLVRDRFPFSPFELALWMSVVPQLLLAAGSPIWGRVLDRLGIVYCRLLIGLLMTAYLASYFVGVLAGLPLLIVLGSVLQGASNGGGQVTWFLASTWFAPRPEDVPLYNGIHFVLNGIRGLVLPWVGAILLVLVGSWSVLAAALVSLASVPLTLRLLRSYQESPVTGAPGLLGAGVRSQESGVRSQEPESETSSRAHLPRVSLTSPVPSAVDS